MALMDHRSAREEAEALYERIILIENEIFYLKVKSTCYPQWDNSEVERLEGLRADYRIRSEQLYEQDVITV
jgi:hypothetical protein